MDVITSFLTALFNSSLQTRIFPFIWKTAKFIPLFKKGDKQNASNYRPISILPTISKILEKAVHTQFYLTENNLISPNQFGFRLKSSTVTATSQLSDQILHSMDNGCLTDAVFLDLAKAFDTVRRGNASLMSELQVLQNKAARLILDLPVHFSAAEALKRLGWKPLLRRRKEHHAIFMNKLISNHFCHSVPVTFNDDFHSYYTRSRNDIRKSSATRRWGHWSSVNSSADIFTFLYL